MTDGETEVFVERRSALGRALAEAWRRPVAWVFGSAALVALAMPAVLPVHRWFADTLATRYPEGSQRVSLDAVFRQDHAQSLEALWSSVASASGWLAALALLLGVFTAGGWLGTLVEGPPRSLRRRYFGGAARHFWRFLRVALLALLALALLDWVLQGAPWRDHVLEGYFGWPDGDTEWAESEEPVRRAGWLRDALHFAGFQLVLMWAVLTRTRLALQAGRSAVLAGAATAWLVVRHPLRTLGPLALLLALELALLVVLGFAAAFVQQGIAPDSGLWRVAVLGGLGLAALGLRELLQGARYAAACEASRGLVGPREPEDPWAERVGGPGGPQYPIGDQDEFSVSL